MPMRVTARPSRSSMSTALRPMRSAPPTAVRIRRDAAATSGAGSLHHAADHPDRQEPETEAADTGTPCTPRRSAAREALRDHDPGSRARSGSRPGSGRRSGGSRRTRQGAPDREHRTIQPPTSAVGCQHQGQEADDADPDEHDREHELVARRPPRAIGPAGPSGTSSQAFDETLLRPYQGRDCSVLPGERLARRRFAGVPRARVPDAGGPDAGHSSRWTIARLKTRRCHGIPQSRRIRDSSAYWPSWPAASRSSTGSSSAQAAAASRRRPRRTSGRSGRPGGSTTARPCGRPSPSATRIPATASRPMGDVRLRVSRGRARDVPADLRAAAGRPRDPPPDRLAAVEGRWRIRYHQGTVVEDAPTSRSPGRRSPADRHRIRGAAPSPGSNRRPAGRRGGATDRSGSRGITG